MLGEFNWYKEFPGTVPEQPRNNSRNCAEQFRELFLVREELYVYTKLFFLIYEFLDYSPERCVFNSLCLVQFVWLVPLDYLPV